MTSTSLLRLDRHVADQIHAAGVAVPAVEDRGHVDVDDVAVLQRLVARDAVADDMVDRDAAALGVAAIAERRRDRRRASSIMSVDDVVELAGGDAGHDVRHERVEDLGGEAAGVAHAGKAFGPVELDRAVAGLDPVVGGDGDIFGHERQYRQFGRADVEPENAMPSHERAIWTAALVVIGDEILSGRTQDKNIAQVATWLNVQGIRLAEVRVVPDDEATDRRGGQRAARRPRLSVHHRRHRPDPRRHHRRCDRRGARRAGGGPSRGARRSSRTITRPAAG